MLNPAEKAILSTLCYSDIFDYPLRKDEIEKFLIGKIPLQNSKFLENKIPGISFKKGYYFLSGREEIIKKRIIREKISEVKIMKAKQISNILKRIPTILLIGISGSLAMKNADQDEDIDFFIITKKGSLWLTRLIIILVLTVLGVRRSKKNNSVENKICLNMLIDERELLLPKFKQNLFTAHEVVQMKPIFTRNKINEYFLSSNSWIENYLPNALKHKPINSSFADKSFVSYYFVFEKVAKDIQLWYMTKKRKKEIVTDTLLAFHPNDNTLKIINEYDKRLKRYNI